MLFGSLTTQVRNAASALARYHRRQPLVLVAVLFLAGVLAGFRWPHLPAALAASVAAACASVFAGGTARAWAGAALLFLLGWSRAAWDVSGRDEESEKVRGLAPKQTFVCRVGSEVAVTPYKGASARYTFAAEEVRTENGALAVRYLPVQVQWFGPRDPPQEGAAPKPGELWRLQGRATVRGGRDRLPMLAVSSGEGRSLRLAPADVRTWSARIERARRQAARRLAIGIESWGVVPSLNQAMMLGCRSEISPEMKRVFTNSGTIHVFAISGMNIALVACMLIVVISALGVPRPYWVLGLAPLLTFYTVASGAQPSAIRACLMAVIYFAAPLIGRRSSGGVALAATALIVYVRTPALVFNIGCTLSFAVMGGLIVFCRPFCDAGRRLLRLPQLKEQARAFEAAGGLTQARWLRWREVALVFFADSVAVSLAAWLASLPLTAFYFARFTPGGFFANLVIAPCAFLVMVAGGLGLVASFVSDWAASCFNHAAGFFTVIMIRTAEVAANSPWGNFRVERWAPWLVWCWFLGLAALAVWLYARRPDDGLAWLEEPGRDR